MQVILMRRNRLYVLAAGGGSAPVNVEVGPGEVGRALFGPYVLGVELASILLMTGLVGAYHLARPEPRDQAKGDGQ